MYLQDLEMLAKTHGLPLVEFPIDEFKDLSCQIKSSPPPTPPPQSINPELMSEKVRGAP